MIKAAFVMIENFLNYLKFERNRSDMTVKTMEDLKAFEKFSKILMIISLGSQ